MNERQQLEEAISHMEAQREVLGDDVVNTSISVLRRQLDKIGATPLDEQRKQATILFADLEGWTAMSDQLDPEEVREVQDVFISAVTPTIQKFGGSIEKYIGDAVLAVFGVPQAHEDDPERAVRAALEIQATLERSRATSHLPLPPMRVGVHTGLVISRVKDRGADFVVTGDTVNLAARLQSAASSGSVLISEQTFRLVYHAFETASMGEIHVKGKAEPVQTYQVISIKPIGKKPRGITGLYAPLVGRTAEFSALQAIFPAGSMKKGHIATIIGEAGIGKSRLVAEVRQNTSFNNVQWVEGRCLSFGNSIAYLPWMEILRQLIRAGLEESPIEVQKKLEAWVAHYCVEQYEDVYPFLGQLLGLPVEKKYKAALESLDGPAVREATIHAVTLALSSATKERPLVIVCEDMHWSDPSSLTLLESLLSLTHQTPILFIAIFRGRKEHGSWQLLEKIIKEYPEEHVDFRLQPLSNSASEGLLDYLVGMEGIPPALTDRILSQAEGNPFYVEEVVRSLIEAEVVVQDETTHRWEVLQDIETVPIPGTLQGVLTARIDRLEGETRHVLQIASVIGRVFLYRVLEAIAKEKQALDEKLHTLEREELVRSRARQPELEYIFKHALTQEAAYNGILKKHRRTFHSQVGEALERLFPDRVEENLGLLAYHWEQAGDKDKAVEYLGRAGDKARNLYAHQEAIDFYQRALNILKVKGDQGQAARTLMKIGLTYHNAFDFQQSSEAYEEGFRLWGAAKEEPDSLPATSHPLRMIVRHVDRINPLKFIGPGEILSHLFSGLLELTPEMDVVPDIAHSWDVLDKGRTYRFFLRNDVYWTDGKLVTADDFAYTFERILDPSTKSPVASLLYDIKGAKAFHNGEMRDPETLGITVSDPFTLIIELEQPAAYFLQLMAVSFPVPRHVVDAYGEHWVEPDKIITNGSFRLQSWQEGELISFVRHERYHGGLNGNITQVDLYLRPWPPKEENLQMYESGALDVFDVWDIPQPMANPAIDRYANEMVSFPDLMTVECGFNTRKPPFDQLKVRQAFAMAFDREGLIERTGGQILPATGGFIPPGMPGHSSGIGLPYNPEKARQLLAEAGYPGGRNFPVIVATDFPGHDEYDPLRYVAEVLGVKIRTEIIEWDDFIYRFRNDPPQIWNMLGHQADYPDPDNFLRANFPWGATGWQNNACERLIEQAREVMDQQERMQLYAQADRIIVEEAAVIPVTYSRHLFLIKPWVNQYPMAPIKTSYWKDVVIEPH